MDQKKLAEIEAYVRPRIRDVYLHNGREMCRSVPVAPPVGYKSTPPLAEQIRAMVRSERLRQEAESLGAESFDEADDFDVGDDYDPRSPYEFERFFDPPVAKAPEKAAEAPSSAPAPTPPEAATPPASGQ